MKDALRGDEIQKEEEKRALGQNAATPSAHITILRAVAATAIFFDPMLALLAEIRETEEVVGPFLTATRSMGIMI